MEQFMLDFPRYGRGPASATLDRRNWRAEQVGPLPDQGVITLLPLNAVPS